MGEWTGPTPAMHLRHIAGLSINLPMPVFCLRAADGLILCGKSRRAFHHTFGYLQQTPRSMSRTQKPLASQTTKYASTAAGQ